MPRELLSLKRFMKVSCAFRMLLEGFEVGLAALHPQPYGQAPAVPVNVHVAGSGVRLGGI